MTMPPLPTPTYETPTGRVLFTVGMMREYAAAVRAATIEECAKMCENIYDGDTAAGDWPTPEQCAAAIRALKEGS